MAIDSLTRGGPGRYALLALLLGALEVAISRLVRPGPVVSAAGLLVSLAVLAVTALAGAAAQRGGQRPGWAGALPGVVYGAASGVGIFFQHTTLSEARLMLEHDRARSQITPEQAMQLANSAAIHLIQFLVGALLLAAFGIVVGSLAGVAARRYFGPAGDGRSA